MSNVFQEIGHGLKVAGEDVVKGVEDVITVGGKVIRAIGDAKALTPDFKAELAKLINDAEPICKEGLIAIGGIGALKPTVHRMGLRPVGKEMRWRLTFLRG
jgi:hypothetical protein